MALFDSKWSDAEQRYLLQHLVHAQWRVDLSDTYTMGYFILGTSTKLSRKFSRRVTRRAVVDEILFLQDRYANFVRFLHLPGVSYSQWDNRVTVTADYRGEGRTESESILAYRQGGKPLYRDLKMTFVVGRADVADFDWLLWSFDMEDGYFWPEIIHGR
ncbi:hypothetical protein C2S51_035441 [Perilla frutescens var. frutescens]|nr:hypothetical protein C2S51_035441 [Perilla frutescens var. frutescens]